MKEKKWSYRQTKFAHEDSESTETSRFMHIMIKEKMILTNYWTEQITATIFYILCLIIIYTGKYSKKSKIK